MVIAREMLIFGTIFDNYWLLEVYHTLFICHLLNVWIYWKEYTYLHIHYNAFDLIHTYINMCWVVLYTRMGSEWKSSRVCMSWNNGAWSTSILSRGPTIQLFTSSKVSTVNAMPLNRYNTSYYTKTRLILIRYQLDF